MKKREWLCLCLLALVAVSALVINIDTIFIHGVGQSRLTRPETKQLLCEVAALFAAAVLILRLVRNRRWCVGLLVLEISVFTWLHQIFLPMAVSLLYLGVILQVGSVICSLLDKEKRFAGGEPATWMAHLVLGWVGMILLFCLMSLAGIGSIPATRIAAVVLGIVTLLPICPGAEERRERVGRLKAWFAEPGTMTTMAAVCYAFVLAMVLLQAGRLNICADYDSLHYGLRSEYVFNDGDGIYENMGSVNVVYTYSKGLETLLLPISGLPSYGFFLSFQVWTVVALLLVCGEITKRFTDCRPARLCMALLAAIPGIMNMSITAKTDIATALFQVIMTYFLLQFVEKQRSADLALAGNAFLLTMVLKPTSLVFSTILAGTVFLFLWVTRSFKVNGKERFFLSWIPAIAMWLLIWLRTWLHTGLPVTSVFTSIWEKMGFTIRYPFKFDSLPSNGGDLGLKGAIKHFLKRIYGVLLSPVSPDMDHVWIAWGTSLIWVFLVLIVLVLPVRWKGLAEKARRPFACLVWMFLTNGAISLVALYLLWQVDGNYFILLYCLLTILACIAIGKVQSGMLARGLTAALIPVVVLNFAVTAISNWQGSLGLNPVKLLHPGYYDHWEAFHEEMEHRGNVEIWDILAENPETRVLVYGEQPDLLMFPCNAQSFVDIAGSGGNFYVSASVQGLVDYFEYAETDYVYLCGGYLKPGEEAWNYVVRMIEEGYLTDIFYENGHGLAKVAVDPVIPEDPEAAVDEFALCYFSGEQQ